MRVQPRISDYFLSVFDDLVYFFLSCLIIQRMLASLFSCFNIFPWCSHYESIMKSKDAVAYRNWV
jgi:hypothetical protein